jgi:transcriptional regulator with XRE-family HTH domain
MLCRMARTTSPTWRAKRLAGELRRLRDASGLTQEAVAEQLGWHLTKVSNIERAKVTVTPTDVALILDVIGVASDVRSGLVDLARNAAKRGWWAAYGDVFTGSYVDMEDSAEEIWEWGPQVIAGPLQTPAYARAVFRAVHPDAPEEEIEQRVRARMARKLLLERDKGAPRLVHVIDEAVFRRGIADRRIMAQQIRALLNTPPNVTVQVLPFSAGLHIALDGPIIVLHFPGNIPPKGYVETSGGDVYVESAEGVKRCTVVFNGVRKAALSPEESATWLTRLAEEYESE